MPPPGPISTTAEPYLPSEYSSVAYPPYPQTATHRIATEQYSAGGIVASRAGLHGEPARGEASRIHWKDLEKKGELLDYLDDGVEVIVFNEACGYQGQWSEVIVVGNIYGPGFGDLSEPIQRLYIMNDNLEKLPGILPSHPIVDATQIESPNYLLLPNNWRNKPIDIPFYDTRTACRSVVVERELGPQGHPLLGTLEAEGLERTLVRALRKGAEILLEHYQKDYPSSLIQVNEVGLLKYFSFARAEEYHIDSRPNAPLKVLVSIPQRYFDTYGPKPSAKPLGSRFKDFTEEIELNTNRFLDRNNGQINTNVLRELLDDEQVIAVLGTEPATIEIFGEEVVWLEENVWADAVLDPEGLSDRTQDRLDDLNERIGDLPESLYNRFVDEETREAIENTVDAVSEAFSDAEEFSNDATAGIQNTIDIINNVQATLGAAPEFGETSAALQSALTDPTVDASNVGDSFDGLLENRLDEDRDLADVLPRIDGTLLKSKYQQLLVGLRHHENLAEALANRVGPPDEMTPTHTEALRRRDQLKNAVEEIEEVIKKVEFYVNLTVYEFKNNTELLEKILKKLEEEKDKFQGDVEGWTPEVDAKRIKDSYYRVGEYISEQGSLVNPPIEWPTDVDTGSDIELAFTKHHRLIYIGYRSKNHTTGNWASLHRYGPGFNSFVRGTPPLDSETTMAYVWKLNDIITEAKQKAPEENFIRWGLKYVVPRPRFIPKPRKETDISAERHKNKTILNKLAEKDDRTHRENAQLIASVALEATYAVEEPVDTGVAYANDAIGFVNRTDDWINNFFDAAAIDDPYSAALIKCLVPNLDFDFLPEIPDFDLQFLRNPILKLLELYNEIAPKGDLLEGIVEAIKRAIMQALKLLYVTAVKLLLETLSAICLQLQAGLLQTIAAAIDPQPSDLISDDAAGNISITGVTPNQAALRDSTTLKAFQEIGVFPLQGLNEIDSLEKIKALFIDVSGMLSAVEICQLTSASPPVHVVDIIKSLIELKHPHFINVLASRSKIIDLFTAFGKYVDQKLCDDIIAANANNTIYNSNYKDLYCNISTELDQARKSLLSCTPGLTGPMIDDVVARENKNNLEIARNLIDSFNSNSIKDMLQPLSIENEAVNFANELAIESMFEPANTALKQELKDFPVYLKKMAEISLPINPDDATVSDVLSGRRLFRDLPYPTEIAKFLRNQYENIESNEVFQILEDDAGFSIKLRSPATLGINQVYDTPSNYYNSRNQKTFDLFYKLHNKKNSIVSPAFTEFAAQITQTEAEQLSGQFTSTTRGTGNDKYSLILRDAETSENIFTYTKKFDPPEFIRDYIEQNFQNVDLATSDITPQQMYFSEFMFSKIPLPTTTQIFMKPSLEKFLQYGVFSQITRDVIAFLGRKVADSKYFEFSDQEVNQRKLSNLELLEFFSYDFLNLEKIKSEGLEKFKKGYNDDLPEPRDGTKQRKNYNSFEVANLQQCIQTIIRVYILEFFIKSIFSSSAFKLSEETEEMLYDYILQRMKKDIPTQFSRIFNYKFFYLARGLHQDKLETSLSGNDYSIDKVMRKYIIEQYKDVASTFNEMMKKAITTADSGPPIEPTSFGEPSLQGATVVGQAEQIGMGVGVGLNASDLFVATTAVGEFLNQIPFKDARRIYGSPEEFIDGNDEKLKNGNFYFENYLKIITYDVAGNAMKTTISPDEFQYDENISEIFFGLRLVYLFPYGSIEEQGVVLTKPEGATSTFPKYSINLDEVGQSIEKIDWMGTALDNASPEAHKRHAHIVTVANVEIQYTGNVEDFAGGYNTYGAAEVTGTVDKKWKNYGFDWSDSKDFNYLYTHRDIMRDYIKSNVRASFGEAGYGNFKRDALDKYLEETGLGIGLMVEDTDGVHEKYWYEMNVLGSTPPEGGFPNGPYNEILGETADYAVHVGYFKKEPDQTTEQYIDDFLIHFYNDFHTYLRSQEGGDIDIERMYARVRWPIIQGVVTSTSHPDTVLRSMMSLDEGLDFLFNYVFPIEKYKTLMSIYSIEAMNDVPGLDVMFSETKAELRTLFNNMDSRGRFSYADTTKVKFIEKIQEQKTEVLLPTTVQSQLENIGIPSISFETPAEGTVSDTGTGTTIDVTLSTQDTEEE